jgi:hypothetical protein
MHRAVLLILLFAAACGRRETITGNWTGVNRLDAGAAGSGPASDEGSPTRAASPDAAATKAAAGDLAPPPPAELAPPDAAAGPEARGATGPEEPGLAARDASADQGDAHPCPDADRCD